MRATLRLLSLAAVGCTAIVVACSNAEFAASPEDAGTDAGGADAGGEAGADAGNASTGDGGCSADAELCDDFESATFPSTQWDGPATISSPNALDLSTDRSTSPTHSIHVTSAADGGPTPGIAALKRTFSGRVLGLDCGFSIWVDEMAAGGASAELATLSIATNASSDIGSGVLNLYVNSGGAWLSSLYYPTDGGQLSMTLATGAIPTARWVRVELSIDVDSAVSRLLFDGNLVVQLPLPVAVPDDNGIVFSLGALFDQLALGYYIDDVVCTPRR